MGEYARRQSDLTDPPANVYAVTPNDDADLALWALALYVEQAGDITLQTWNGDTVPFTNCPPGILPVRTRRVYSTGTTASGLVALY